MAKKKKTRGKAKGKRGAASTKALIGSLGPKRMEVVRNLQQRYDRDTLLCAYRTFPKLSKKIEDGLAKMPEAKAKEIRAELLKVM